MELNEYPRPANDTGIGVHWVVGYATAIGISRIREYWIPELKSMGVKWVKIFNHDSALDFCELLLAEGIMPVVRIYRPSPNPGRLGVKELVLIDALIRAGVRYFEFNNEPDVDAEWKGGRVPVNGIELTVESTIANMEIVLERGGMPAVPALANGSRWDLIGRIVAAGRRDLFDGPVWQAVHNFSRNRPLDYPYDIGNQEGAAFTERFFRVLASESWGEDAWRGRSLAEVNRLRYDRRSPGASVMDDHACFLAYEYCDALNRKHLGRSIPILSTECGYLVGEDTDPRYPATTPDLHMAQTLEACRVMMGTSQRFKAAPDYYFCTAFWLLANQQLGSSSTWWESNAWYSERWPNGVLPVVRALQAEPKVPRVAQTPPVPTVVLSGVIANAPEGAALDLLRDDRLAARTRLEAGGRFSLPDLDVGRYLLRVEGTPLEQPIELYPGQGEVVITLDAAPQVEVVSRSVISGRVQGGAGAVVMLVRQADGEEWVTMARDDGEFRFVDLPPGRYHALVYPGGSEAEGIVVDGRDEAQVNLAVGGWGYTLGIASDVQKVGAIVVATPGHAGLRVQAHTADWSSPIALTGEATEYGPFAACIAPLEADYYFVTVDGAVDESGRPTQLEARVQVDKRAIPRVEFVFVEPSAAAAGATTAAAAAGAAAASAGAPAAVAAEPGVEGGETGRASAATSSGTSPAASSAGSSAESAAEDVPGRTHEDAAGGLPAATAAGTGSAAAAHPAQVAGAAGMETPAGAVASAPASTAGMAAAAAAADVPDGAGTYALPPGGPSDLAGLAPDAGGRDVHCIDAVGNERWTTTDNEGRFRFDLLPPGVYSVFVDGGYQQGGIELDGTADAEIQFAPVIAIWETTVTNAGTLPGFSSVRVEVEGMANLPVRVWQGAEEGLVARTGGSAGEQRAPNQPDAHQVEFRGLDPGRYFVEPEGLGVWVEVQITGLEALWVSFRRKNEPVSPNEVRRVPRHAGYPPARAGMSSPAAAAAAAPGDSLAGKRGIYVFVASPPQKIEQQLALLNFVASQRPQVGSDLAAAAEAGVVLLLDEAEPSPIEQELLLQNVTVARARGDWVAFFNTFGG